MGHILLDGEWHDIDRHAARPSLLPLRVSMVPCTVPVVTDRTVARRGRAGAHLRPPAAGFIVVLVLLAAGALSFGDGHPRRRWGRDAAAWRARQARDVAVEAFYRMDHAQRQTRVRVDAYTNLDAGTAAAGQVRQQFDAVSARADELAARYIATLDAHPVDDDLSAAQFTAAAGALEAISRDLDAAAGGLTAFCDRFAAELSRVEQALEQLAPRAERAQRALADTRAAVAAVRSQGIAPGAAGDALAAAEAAAEVLAQGAGRLGIAAALRQADQVQALADRGRALAEDLPRKQKEISQRLVSLGTRREALGNRAGDVAGQLRVLRRAYVEGCWADLADSEARVVDWFAAADRALDRAARLSQVGDWDAALGFLRDAAGALDDAAGCITAVSTRRATLDEVKADPARRVSEARFAVRDAQRLVMQGRTLPPAPWAGQLDALAARLDRAQEPLDRPHPDYWAFLTEIRSVTDATAELVRRFRAQAGT